MSTRTRSSSTDSVVRGGRVNPGPLFLSQKGMMMRKLLIISLGSKKLRETKHV